MAIIVIYSFNQIVKAMMEYSGAFEESFTVVWSSLRTFHCCLGHNVNSADSQAWLVSLG